MKSDHKFFTQLPQLLLFTFYFFCTPENIKKFLTSMINASFINESTIALQKVILFDKVDKHIEAKSIE